MARVSALNGAAWLAIDQGDYAEAARLLGESIGLSQALDDTVGEGIATVYLGRCKLSSLRIAEAAPDVERAAALLTGRGTAPAIAFSLLYSGLLAQFTGQLEAACDLFARCAAMSAELGLEPLNARAKQMLGCALLDLGELAAARAALEEGLPGSIDVGDRWIVPIGLAGFRRARGQDRAAPAGAPAGRCGRGVPGRQRVHHAGADPARCVDRWLAPARSNGRVRRRPGCSPKAGG